MKKLFTETKNSFLLSSITLVIFGIFLLFWPSMTGLVVGYAFGAFILLFGVINLIAFFRKNKDETVYHYKLIIGFVAMAVGIFVLIRPEVVMTIIPYALGFMLLFDCYLNVRQMLSLRKIGSRLSTAALVVALLTLAVGALFIINPFGTMSALAIFMGISLIFDGASNIWVIIVLARALKNPSAVAQGKKGGE